MSADVNPQIYGNSLTFTATLTPSTPTPTGTVTFYDGTKQIGAPQTLNGSGQATLAISLLTAGPHTVKASYSGDANYLASNGTKSETINPATLIITANGDSKTYGQTKTYGAGSTAFTPSGLQNGETIGSVTIAASEGRRRMRRWPATA